MIRLSFTRIWFMNARFLTTNTVGRKLGVKPQKKVLWESTTTPRTHKHWLRGMSAAWTAFDSSTLFRGNRLNSLWGRDPCRSTVWRSQHPSSSLSHNKKITTFGTSEPRKPFINQSKPLMWFDCNTGATTLCMSELEASHIQAPPECIMHEWTLL